MAEPRQQLIHIPKSKAGVLLAKRVSILLLKRGVRRNKVQPFAAAANPLFINTP